MSQNNWSAQLPVYATRPSADGTVGAFYVSAWLAFFIQVLILVNMIGWGVYGLVELASKVV